MYKITYMSIGECIECIMSIGLTVHPPIIQRKQLFFERSDHAEHDNATIEHFGLTLHCVNALCEDATEENLESKIWQTYLKRGLCQTRPLSQMWELIILAQSQSKEEQAF